MRKSNFTCKRHIIISVLSALLLTASVFTSASAQVQNTAPAAATPSDAVRLFYKALSEKRFRDALTMSVYAPAIEGLSDKDLEDLRPDFETLAAGAEKVVVQGEQISGDSATVFVKLKDDDPQAPPLPVQMRRVKGNWIIYDEEVEQAVKREGNKFFFNARIKAHENDVQNMLINMAQKELLYSTQNNGMFADLPTLVREGLLRDDILNSQSTGYNFHITLSADRKSYTAGAEPAVYGRTGKLSFFMDTRGVKSADNGGKPYTPKK